MRVMATCFRELLVWQKSIVLTKECHAIARRLPRAERTWLGGQLTRAAASVPANIAEGNGRQHRAEYLHFLSIASGSANEVESHLRIVEAIGFHDAVRLDETLTLAREVGRMLGGLIRALRAAPRNRR